MVGKAVERVDADTLQHLMFTLGRRLLLSAGLGEDEVELRGIKQLQRRGLQIVAGLDPEVDVEAVDEDQRPKRMQIKLGQAQLKQLTAGAPARADRLDDAIGALYNRSTVHLRPAGYEASDMDMAFDYNDCMCVRPFTEPSALVSLLLDLAGTTSGQSAAAAAGGGAQGLAKYSTSAKDVVRAAGEELADRALRSEWDGAGELSFAPVPGGLLGGEPSGGRLTALRPSAGGLPGAGDTEGVGGAIGALAERMAQPPILPDALRLANADGGEAADDARAAAAFHARLGESRGGGLRKIAGSHASSILAAEDNVFLAPGADRSLFGALRHSEHSLGRGELSLSLSLPALGGPFDPLAGFGGLGMGDEGCALGGGGAGALALPAPAPAPAPAAAVVALPPAPAAVAGEALAPLSDPGVWQAVAAAPAAAPAAGGAPAQSRDWDMGQASPGGREAGGIGLQAAGGVAGVEATESRFFSESGAAAFDGLYRRHFSLQPLHPEEPVVEEAVLVEEAILVLQGVPSATLQRLGGEAAEGFAVAGGAGGGALPAPARGLRPRLRSAGGASVASVLRTLAEAGGQRARLDRFVARFSALPSGITAASGGSEGSGPPGGGFIQQAFAQAVGSVLRAHSATLHVLPVRAQERRAGAGGGGGGGPAPGGVVPGRPRHAAAATAEGGLTLLELLVHTRALRDQVALLSWLCHCSPPLGGPAGRCAWEDADPGFPRGHGLLSYLHTHLMQADSTAEPLLRYLFAGALRPFMRQLRGWMFEGEVMDPFGEFLLGGEAGEEAGEGAGGEGRAVVARGFLGGAAGLAEEYDSALPVWGGRGAAAPEFLQAVADKMHRAGQQLRVLRRVPVARPFALQLATIAAEEALEAAEVAAEAREWGSIEPAELAAGLEGSAWGGSLPVLFTSAALRGLAAVQARAAAAREAEGARLAARLTEAREVAAQAEGEERLRQMAAAAEEDERRRAERAAAAARARAVKLQLWRTQKAELAGRAASAAVARQAEVAMELAYARESALAERRELERELGLADLAEAAAGRAEALEGREAHLAWRARRMEIAEQRRKLLAAQAMLEAEALRFHVLEGRAIPEDLSLVASPAPARGPRAPGRVAGVAPIPAPFGTFQDEGAGAGPAARTPGPLANPYGTAADEAGRVAGRIRAIVSAPYGTSDRSGDSPAAATAAATEAGRNAPWATAEDTHGAGGAAPAGAEHLGAAAAVNAPWARPGDERATAGAQHVGGAGARVEGPYGTARDNAATAGSEHIGNAAVSAPFGSAADEVVRRGHEHAGGLGLAAPYGTSPGGGGAPPSPASAAAAAGSAGDVGEGGRGVAPSTPGREEGAAATPPPRGSERRQWGPGDADPFLSAGKPSSPIPPSSPVGREASPFAAGLLAAPPSPPLLLRFAATDDADEYDDDPADGGGWAAGSGHGEEEVLDLSLGGVESGAPLPVVIDTCIARGILAQYRCISRATLDVLELELGLSDVLAAVQRVYFMKAGDFAEGFAMLLCRRLGDISPGAPQGRGGPRPPRPSPGGALCSEVELQGMMEAALKGSSLDGDQVASGMRAEWAASAPVGGGGLLGVLSDQKIDALDPARLRVEVQWPLSLVITQESLDGYAGVYSALLRFKRASFALQDIWHMLQDLDKELAKAENAARRACRRGEPDPQEEEYAGGEGGEEGVEEGVQGGEPGTPPRTPARTPGARGAAGGVDTPGPMPRTPALAAREADSPEAAGRSLAARREAQRRRLRRMQLFRHEIDHFVQIVQAYMHSQVVGSAWDKFQEARRSHVSDLGELRAAHEAYVAEACQRCMLSQETRAVREIVTDSLQRVLDFRQHLRTCRGPAGLEQEDVYEGLRRTHLSFRTRMQYLYRVLRSLALRGQLRGLFVQLDFNSFYAKTAQ